ncbi:MAG: hypothetical protein LH614_17815 [Pyrinomonadaceae bacterium]|nr:hypothetical protein [Pyrinomonadaceae bacterium]
MHFRRASLAEDTPRAWTLNESKMLHYFRLGAYMATLEKSKSVESFDAL